MEQTTVENPKVSFKPSVKNGTCAFDFDAKDDAVTPFTIKPIVTDSPYLGAFSNSDVSSWTEILECKPFITFEWTGCTEDRIYFQCYWTAQLIKRLIELTEKQRQTVWTKLTLLSPRTEEPDDDRLFKWIANKLNQCSFSSENIYELYFSLSFINHSCWPNCVQIFDHGVLHLYSVRDIKAGEELTICYILDNGMTNVERRNALGRIYNFDCTCPACIKSDELTPLYWIIKDLMLCHVCKQKAEYRCNKCKILRYCSSECQKKDWKSHKTTCIHMSMTLASLCKI